MDMFKRKTFYLSGFDPRGAPYYHRFHQEQVASYALHSNEQVAVSTRRPQGSVATGWQVVNDTQGVVNDYVCLRWEDIVRRAWIARPLELLGRGIVAYAGYIAHADWGKVLALPRAPLIALFYPLAAMILLPLLFFVPLVWLAGLLLPQWAALPLALAIAIGGAVPLLVKMKALWLIRLFVFNDDLARRRADPALSQRLDDFADLIVAGLNGPHDEILLVTHSNGSILAIPLMERVLKRTGGVMPERFALVTLGHCIPLVACRRDALDYRAQLRTLAAHDFRWVDIGFPPDGACYALVNPLGLVSEVVRTRIDMMSPRFFRFYETAAYEVRRRNKYDLHFEYLRSSDRPSPIDHVSLTAGRRTLAEAVAAFRAID
jgi:hypothetical protein